jgi:uncharacterized phosphosugar-binding protein
VKFFRAIQGILSEIDEQESGTLEAAAQACAESIGSERGVLLFGAGHSALPPQEAFPRIGSLVGFIQITEPVLSYNGHVTGKGGQQQMSFLEQTSGLAETILANYRITDQDTMLIISNSGINAVPVEFCHLANQKGLTTIGISSRAHSNCNQPKNPIGKRLLEIAQIPIDTHIPEGDALIQLASGENSGGGSTIASMVILNAIVVRTAEILLERKFPVTIYPSHNISGDLDDLHQKEFEVFEKYKELLKKY